MEAAGDQLTFRAALSRLLVGGAALVLLPAMYPLMRPYTWVFVAYLAISAVEQVLIAKRVGGRVRAFVAGVVDLALITWFVHLLGSTTTVLAAIYFFAGILNALVVGLRVGVALAILNVVVYDAVIWAEYVGWLPFAPLGPDTMRNTVPSFETTVIACVFVTVLLVSSTAVVGILVRAVRRHEVDLTAANLRLEELSQRDPLTGLYNRRYLFMTIERELARVRRGHPLGVVMLDLDGFKRINDTQGHMRGDLLLREIAVALGTSTRTIDVAVRYGGDEFMLVLPDTDPEQARVVAGRVTEAVREVGARFDPAQPVTASVGLAVAHEDDGVATLIRRADESAYTAKRAGGDRVVLAA